MLGLRGRHQTKRPANPQKAWAAGGREQVSAKPRTHRKMRKLETPNMMKVIPVPSATIARVESGAEGERGP